MTTKTINCAECEVEFTYEENPRFPRKYCLNCSAKKKASFEANKTDIIHEHPGSETITDAKLEVDRYPHLKEKPKDNGFHLTDESVNLGALQCTVETFKDKSYSDEVFWETFKIFKRRILTGE